MRRLPYSKLSLMFEGLSSSTSRKYQFALDALPLLKTEAGVRLMADIVGKGLLEQDDSLKDSWFGSLVFYKNPTRGMISAVTVIHL